ncbi:type VII secretion protein EccB [Streptomyces sp. NPDC051664]|uniref:type VII secretion protein EccB n=1 Tax=Streptomyces sp. NPDC051664 TaxID=3365668 RepID=UPI0037BD7299
MKNKRDQVQAHRFVVSRLTSGLMRTDPDILEGPNSRTNKGMTIGGVIGAVLAVGALVYGFISPGGSNAWQDQKTLIIEQNTGNRYLYDGALRPVRNYSSARLIVGETMTSRNVPARSLADVSRGSAVGIPGAPDNLPPTENLDIGPWEVCAATDATDSGRPAPSTSLVVDENEPGVELDSSQALLVSSPDKRYYLLWHGSRFRLGSGSAAADALGYGTVRPLAVSVSFLDSLPAGPDLAAPAVAGGGAIGPRLEGKSTRVGQVFEVKTPGSSKQYYLLQRAGLVPITITEAALALGDPDERTKSYGGSTPVAIQIAADSLNWALAPHGRPAISSLPPAPPMLVPISSNQAVCVRLEAGHKSGASKGNAPITDVAGRIGITVAHDAQFEAGGVTAPKESMAACLPVDTVVVPPNGGSLVRALGASGDRVGATTYLVTDAGVKHLIASDTAAKALGYDPAGARGIPSPLLAMLPTGVDLSQPDALQGQATTTNASGCATNKTAQ